MEMVLMPAVLAPLNLSWAPMAHNGNNGVIPSSFGGRIHFTGENVKNEQMCDDPATQNRNT